MFCIKLWILFDIQSELSYVYLTKKKKKKKNKMWGKPYLKAFIEDNFFFLLQTDLNLTTDIDYAGLEDRCCLCHIGIHLPLKQTL